jgi:flagellar basal-body rod modification protein FlgD
VKAAVNLPATADLTLELTGADGKVTTVSLGSRAVGDADFPSTPQRWACRRALRHRCQGCRRHQLPRGGGRHPAGRAPDGGRRRGLAGEGLGDVSPASITRFVGQQA